MTPTRYAALINACALVVLGCMPTPPIARAVPAPAQIDASFGRVWDAVIEHFAANSVPIRTIERVSGIIITEEMVVLERDAKILADCGKDAIGSANPADRASYNVLVRGDSVATSMRVTATFGVARLPGNPYVMRQCVSLGVFERQLMAAVRLRAESR